MASNYDDILDGVVTDIRGLGLLDVKSGNILKTKIPRKLKNDQIFSALPCVAVAPFGSVARSEYSNIRDKVVYPVLVAAIAASENSPTANITRHTLWLQKIQRAFRPRGGNVSVAESSAYIMDCVVAPRGTYDLPAWFEQYDIGDVLLRFNVAEVRT